MVGAKQSVGAPDAVHGSHALVAPVLPLRRRGERSRRRRRGQQRVPPGLAGGFAAPGRGVHASRSSRAWGRASPSTRRRSPTSIRPTTSSSTTRGSACPGTTLTNWPDENIHSSGDDLWQIDPTQLKRNAFVVAATAWWLASAEADDVPFLASFVAARGAERLGRDLATAQAWIAGRQGHATKTAAARRRTCSTSGARKELAAVDSARHRPRPGADPAAIAEGKAALRAVGSALKARVARPADSAEDPALERLSRRTPRYAVTTLDAWMALEAEGLGQARADARTKRDQKEQDEARARPARSRRRRRRPPTPNEPRRSHR